jgi:hypothetical protein
MFTFCFHELSRLFSPHELHSRIAVGLCHSRDSYVLLSHLLQFCLTSSLPHFWFIYSSVTFSSRVTHVSVTSPSRLISGFRQACFASVMYSSRLRQTSHICHAFHVFVTSHSDTLMLLSRLLPASFSPHSCVSRHHTSITCVCQAFLAPSSQSSLVS